MVSLISCCATASGFKPFAELATLHELVYRIPFGIDGQV
jgi:hypothetical protein